MLRFFGLQPSVGIEITPSAIRAASLTGRGSGSAVEFTNIVRLPAGMVSGGFAAPHMADVPGLGALLRECLQGAPRRFRRAGLSIPDSAFRIQTLEFDTLPQQRQDQERTVRWRLEKSAAIDLSDTVLRFQVAPRRGNGMTVLACVAKQAVIAQYEQLLAAAGLEPWQVGASSLHAMNLFAPLLMQASTHFALTCLTEDSFATIAAGTEGATFYRFKEMKRCGPDEIRSRLTREIEDSLHFYAHRDRTQPAEIRHLYLTGEPGLAEDVAHSLQEALSLPIRVLSPSDVIAGFGERTAADGAFAAAFGAGRML